MRTEFEAFRVEFELFDPATRVVLVRSTVGSFSAVWKGHDDPEPGDWSYVEFQTWSEPTAVWGSDVVAALPDEPDAIIEEADGWIFVGKVLGVEPGTNYGDGGTLIPAHDLEDGIFYVRIGESILMFCADGLPSNAAGRRVRVRETSVELYPE